MTLMPVSNIFACGSRPSVKEGFAGALREYSNVRTRRHRRPRLVVTTTRDRRRAMQRRRFLQGLGAGAALLA
ncbi:MAG: hypothetical protein M3O86_01535, partial [Actinomycetota bacterium]|nr:hypothetical protein [Actinomycetota bacterium]